MDFRAAMDALKAGRKVTRERWSNGVYFSMEGKEVKSCQPMLSTFVYNEDIMISDGWLITEGENFHNQKEFSFSEIIPFLHSGYKAKLKEWKEQFIFLDNSIKALALHSMEIFPFIPQFNDFIAQDWIEII